MSRETVDSDMHKRLVTLADGRYLIFYTFEAADAESTSAGADASETLPEPDLVVPEAADERLV